MALVKLPIGPRLTRLWSHHDLLTMNEIYFRRDYQVSGHEKTIVDFGSNIGISALYFLDFAPKAHVYLFEPVSTNIERLKIQLEGWDERYTLTEVAVGIEDGLVSFGIENSGRYGGIGKSLAKAIEVQCRPANVILSKITQDRGIIDLLKFDIEGAERSVVEI